jgi:putative spermidine/putrescine transport system permease protein
MSRRVVIALFVVFMVLPLAAGFTYSLLYSLGLAGLLGKGFTTAHWATLLGSGEIWSSLAYTGLLTVISLALMLAIALPLAYALHFGHKSKGMQFSLYLPLAVPPLIAAFAWNQILSPSGIVSRIANHVGLSDGIDTFPRLVNDFANVGILTTHVFLLFPLFTLVFLNIARKENLSGMRDMSATLGATQRQFFTQVFAPMLLQRAGSLLLLYAVFLLGAYEVPLLLGRSSPRVVTLMIVDKVGKFDLAGIPVGHAMAVLYSLLVGIIVTAMIWRSNRSSHALP